jgi:hypothetical protein
LTTTPLSSGSGLRKLLLVPIALLAILVMMTGVSVVGALSTPGNENFQAKWADWLRNHDAAFLADDLERYYYQHHAPAKGGAPRHLNAVPAAGLGTGRHLTFTAADMKRRLPLPRPVPLVVAPPLPGEGQWRPTGSVIGGVAAMYEAQFRADTVYTSQITTAVWIDPNLLRVSLVPGAREPGGAWPATPYINRAQIPYAVAAFNGGFRLKDAQGGFYLDHRTVAPLRDGAASMVTYTDGRVDIGRWGSEVTMTPKVVSVVQNLVPMVDGGRVAPDATYDDHHIWGFTLGSKTVVARSGIGVTADGALVYVAGPALTAKTLAESLQRAGAVRAMTLDINPYWVTFNFFQHPSGVGTLPIVPIKLYPQMQRPATRYLGPTPESRYFFLLYLPTVA